MIRDIFAIKFILVKKYYKQDYKPLALHCKLTNVGAMLTNVELETLNRKVVFLSLLGAQNQKYGPTKSRT